MGKLFKKILKTILYIFLILALIILIIFKTVAYQLDKIYTPEMIAKKVNSKRNEIMYTKYEDVDKKYIDALIAAEDHRFYYHAGIDFISILRAIRINIKNKDFIEGGSTITQQLIKNMFFSQDVSINRKIKEGYVALKFEKMYSKKEILELYMNTSYFGSGYYNILEASIGYFEKYPNNLTMTESVFLAGVPNAPAVYDPRVDDNKAHQRRNQVLAKMVKNNVITKEKAEDLSKERIVVIDKALGKKRIKEEKEKRGRYELTK